MRRNQNIRIAALLAAGIYYSPSLAQDISNDYLDEAGRFGHESFLETGACLIKFPSFPKGDPHCPNICIYNMEKLTYEERLTLSNIADQFLSDGSDIRTLIMNSNDALFLHKTCRKSLENKRDRELKRARFIEETFDQCILQNLDKVHTDAALKTLHRTCRNIANRSFSNSSQN